ncbi:hypothetical protein NOZE110980_11310 [Nocardioides zeicaulis]
MDLVPAVVPDLLPGGPVVLRAVGVLVVGSARVRHGCAVRSALGLDRAGLLRVGRLGGAVGRLGCR